MRVINRVGSSFFFKVLELVVMGDYDEVRRKIGGYRGYKGIF